MTSLLPRMVVRPADAGQGMTCTPSAGTILPENQATNAWRAIDTPRHGQDDGSVSHLRTGSKDPGSAKFVRGRLPSVPPPRGEGFPERMLARCRYSLDCCKLFARGAAVGSAPRPSDTPASPWNSLIIGNY